MLKSPNALNIQANANMIANRNNWLVEFLDSDILVLAISNLPPGNVGIGNKETQPKKHNMEPALASG